MTTMGTGGLVQGDQDDRVKVAQTNYANELGIEKVEFVGSEPAFVWREIIKTTPSSPDRDSNLDLPILGSLAQHETSMLANYAIEVHRDKTGPSYGRTQVEGQPVCKSPTVNSKNISAKKQNMELNELWWFVEGHEFKDLVAKKFSADVDQLCLIFAGKIMKDHENLQNHNIKDGLTVHLVIKTTTRSSDNTSANQPRPPGK
uniref:Ubiquitin-like domain-containing protein n=1 Tax=Timema tahoe TaxID=61484 RepID=A0A7R9NYR4_9NEOP|nr:unnamed protein product [Timema tahoe]